ncbi:MAG: peptidyl-prolyl cis-trans isomerase [Balneolaceae bacterium]|nr:peptidyl-prolyl cis-trans isomerase [Balneolaceae bacterium]MCH8547335.1 peptidyl-prolyl cis-trans isomerase [Balneolaceae bacterium]
MKRITHIFLLTAIVAMLLFSCERTERYDDSPVLATVGNHTLTLEQAYSLIPPTALEQDTLNALNSFIDQWVNEQVAVQHAERAGLENNEDVKNRLERLRRQVLHDALKEYVLNVNLDEIEVTRDEAQDYYQANRNQFTLDERMVRFRHITTRTRTEIDNANRALMRGVDWEEIVERYSVNPERQLRESNQFWPISMAAENIPALNRYLQRIGLSERSPIHFDGSQYHLVQLLEERPAGDSPDLEWLIPQIEEWLRLEKARRVTNSYMRNLYLEADANNEIHKTNVTEIESMIRDHQ